MKNRFLIAVVLSVLVLFGGLTLFLANCKANGSANNITEITYPAESTVKEAELYSEATLLPDSTVLSVYDYNFSFYNINTNNFISLGNNLKKIKDEKSSGEKIFYLKGKVKIKAYFENGILSGNVTVNFPNKDIYCGEIKDGKLWGKGAYQFADGCFYEGEFRGGKIAGYGKAVYKNNDRYEGCFKDAMRNDSNGKYIFECGVIHEGNFENNAITGYGKRTFKDGYYEGEFSNGLRNKNGKFIYTLSDIYGDYYIGEYQNDKQNGKGAYYDASKNTLKSGIWEDGMRISYSY